jgi:hypothetical protein
MVFCRSKSKSGSPSELNPAKKGQLFWLGLMKLDSNSEFTTLPRKWAATSQVKILMLQFCSRMEQNCLQTQNNYETSCVFRVTWCCSIADCEHWIVSKYSAWCFAESSPPMWWPAKPQNHDLWQQVSWSKVVLSCCRCSSAPTSICRQSTVHCVWHIWLSTVTVTPHLPLYQHSNCNWNLE